MKNLKFTLLIVFGIMAGGLQAQTGTVEGKVYRTMDGTEEPLYMALVAITDNGLRKVGQSNFDGTFKLTLPAGENKILFKNTGMNLRTDTVIFNIVADKTQQYSHEMVSEGTLTTIVVTGKISNDGGTEIKAVEDTKNDDKVTTQMTGSQISNKGASAIDDAAQKMTGLSTVGSTLYVRGLGDRYNVAYLNNLPIPSPHPDFRVVPLSVFPTDIVSSIQVSKVMSAELYGDFSGGAFNITTKGFYDSPTLKLTVGTGGNTQTTFKDFRTYEGGRYDYFGFDDGTRQIPEYVINNSKANAYQAVNDIYFNGTYRSLEGNPTGFNDNFGTKLTKAMPNTNFSITGGNFYPAAKSKGKSQGFGFLALLSHENSYKYANGSLKIINAQSEERLNYDFEKYVKETATTGLLNLYYRLNPKNNISFNTLFVNNSEDETRETWGFHFDYADKIYSRRLTYQQNFMSVNQIIGTHQLLPYVGDTNLTRLTVDWRGSYSITGSQEPDRRQFVAFYDDKEATDSYTFNVIDKNENHIFYSKLQENELAGKFNVSYALKYGDVLNKRKDTITGEVITLRAGADYKSKSRIFDYKQYNYILNDLASAYSDDINIYDVNNYLNSNLHEQGQFYIEEVSNFGSSYLANLDVMSFYTDVKFKFNNIQIIPGLRYESGSQTIENRNQQSPSDYEKTILLSDAFLPSLITKINVGEDDIMRFVASKTLTRPKFNEVAPFQYVLYFAGAKAQGNTALENGTNYNVDFRYEHYGKPGELISFGAFYKYLDKPIEQTMLATASGQLMSFANASSANVAGVEVELLRSLDFLVRDEAKRDSSFLKFVNLGFNASYMYTSVIIDTTNSGAINTNTTRPLEGASPYLINFDLSYRRTIENKSYLLAMAYNVFGPRLYAVGSNGIGDQYERPVNSLNLVSKITFNDTYSFGLKAKNLLNPTINIVQEDMEDRGTLNVSSFKRGIDLSLSFTYHIPVGNNR